MNKEWRMQLDGFDRRVDFQGLGTRGETLQANLRVVQRPVQRWCREKPGESCPVMDQRNLEQKVEREALREWKLEEIREATKAKCAGWLVSQTTWAIFVSLLARSFFWVF
jgi:hypothetical protein